MSSRAVDVITIDGPGGVGKGTLSRALVRHLGWHSLESGALYRLLAWHSLRENIDLQDTEALVAAVPDWKVRFVDGGVEFNGEELSAALRAQAVEERASRVAQVQEVREALLEYQRSCLRAPGLVAEGRDMGSVVFPDAPLKIFLTASEECRARRRYEQLKANGEGVKMETLLINIRTRDKRDRERAVSPLVCAADAVKIDSTNLGARAVSERVLELWKQNCKKRAQNYE